MKKIALVFALLALTVGVSAQNFSLNPYFGEVSLRAGFSPDPHVVNVTPGGNINLRDARSRIGISAAGYIADAPDVRLQYTSGSYNLTIKVDGAGTDTVLLINGPNGDWFYDDDTNGLNPQIRFNSPSSGQYDIWVGTYSNSRSSSSVRLEITEL